MNPPAMNLPARPMPGHTPPAPADVRVAHAGPAVAADPAVGSPPDAASANLAPHEGASARMEHLFRASARHGYLHPLYLPLLKYRQCRP